MEKILNNQLGFKVVLDRPGFTKSLIERIAKKEEFLRNLEDQGFINKMSEPQLLLNIE